VLSAYNRLHSPPEVRLGFFETGFTGFIGYLLLGFPDESQEVQSPSANLKRYFGFTFPPCGIVLLHFHPESDANNEILFILLILSK
jgi:hypothetical protein